MKESVAIVGGGMAGLSAALELAATNSVTVIEARDRLGGRILTRHSEIPTELGAEFVHGKTPETWRFIKAADLTTHEVPDRHWKFAEGTLVELSDFWEQLSSVTGEIKPRERDKSFAEFLDEIRKPRESVELAAGFIEGFHAAPLEAASTQATRLSEKSSEKLEGQRAFRINEGSDRLVEYLERECRGKGVCFRTNCEVSAVKWDTRPVAVQLSNGDALSADRVIVTLPIGVLKRRKVTFDPAPQSKLEAIDALEMGVVTKVVMHFRERFWPEPNFGFVHSEGEWFSTWWADPRGNLLTAWAGGPNGQKLAVESDHFIRERALESVSVLFGERLSRVRELLLATYSHNWTADRFARGAYSFIPVDGVGACRELARSEEELLFFAGEATDLNYQFGTVHAAIASGFRAAREVQSLSPARRD
jgi:monoamine oxidase